MQIRSSLLIGVTIVLSIRRMGSVGSFNKAGLIIIFQESHTMAMSHRWKHSRSSLLLDKIGSLDANKML